jgi:hypothetical protein
MYVNGARGVEVNGVNEAKRLQRSINVENNRKNVAACSRGVYIEKRVKIQ